MRTQTRVVHYPTLKTILAIEEAVKRSNTPLSRNQILARLSTGVMRSTLNLALDYMERRGIILETRKGYIWTLNTSKKVERAEKDRQEMVSEVKNKILPLLKEHGVIKAAIFGSVARGEAKKDSDVDILVEFKETPTLFGIGGLYADIKKKLGRRPDIVTYKSVDRKLRPDIMRYKVDIL